MNPLRIFISSVQKELAAERTALRDYLQGDPLFHRYERCREAGLPEPDIRIDGGFWITTISRKSNVDSTKAQSRAQSGAQSEAQSLVVLRMLADRGELSASALAITLGLQSKTGACKRSLQDLLDQKQIEYTIPDNPSSRLQKYRITAEGRERLESLEP